jgi:sphingolipid 4-desaturase/C4-monooxygenase
MSQNFIRVTYGEPHIARTKQILSKHPEIKKLFGNTPSTALYITGIVALQIGLAIALSSSPWWVILAAAYVIGAIANHGLWVLIHDCTHNLVFKGSNANRLWAIFCNLPFIFPGAISFRNYHLKHHRYQGDPQLDADLAMPIEAKLVGSSTFRKALWLFVFPIAMTLRTPRLKIKVYDHWIGLNILVEVAFLGAITYFFGWSALGYLTASSLSSLGLHPVGARWIQEHYVVYGNQETYSYYGPLNRVAFNVGYHNEHHDLMVVPWSRLPQVRAMAPEFYNTLYFHESWTKLMLKFIFDKNLSLYSRVIRPTQAAQTALRKGSSTVKVEPAEGLLTT